MKNIINTINKHFKPLIILDDKVDKAFIKNLKSVIRYYNINNADLAIKIIDELDNKECELSVELIECLKNIKKDLQN